MQYSLATSFSERHNTPEFFLSQAPVNDSYSFSKVPGALLSNVLGRYNGERSFHSQ